MSGSATVNTGLVGTLRLRTTPSFSDTEVWLEHAELTRGGQTETISPAAGVALQVAAPPSPDFDGDGVVGFSDFVAFAGVFGSQRGDGKYVAKYDLNNDGSIGFDDLLIFAESFGDAVNRAPVFGDGSSTSRTLAENTPARRPIQHPVNASDPDGHRVTYNLSGADSASFSVATGSGQLRTLSGITYDFEDNDRYSVDLVGSDPYGESATIGVTIHVADVNEPPEIPAAPLVQPASTTSLTVTWDAPDNTGPDITDYDVQIRKSGNFLPHSHDGPGTSATIIELDVNTRYEVQVRATNDEGTSLWLRSGFGTTSSNLPPVFDEGQSTTREVTENTTGTTGLGGPVSASDPENTAVTYSLSRGVVHQPGRDVGRASKHRPRDQRLRRAVPGRRQRRLQRVDAQQRTTHRNHHGSDTGHELPGAGAGAKRRRDKRVVTIRRREDQYDRAAGETGPTDADGILPPDPAHSVDGTRE